MSFWLVQIKNGSRIFHSCLIFSNLNANLINNVMISGACMAMGIEICYSLCFFFLFSIINKDKIKKKKKREEYFNFNIKQIFWILLGRSTCRKSSTGSNKRLIFVMVESSSCSATWFLITSTCCSTHKYIQVVIFFYFFIYLFSS